MFETPDDPYQLAVDLLQFDRIAKRHRNHRLVKNSDLQFARDLAKKGGREFPVRGQVDILRLVDGPRSERSVRALVTYLRTLEQSGFLNAPPPVPAPISGHDDSDSVKEEDDWDTKTSARSNEKAATGLSRAFQILHRSLVVLFISTFFCYQLYTEFGFFGWPGPDNLVLKAFSAAPRAIPAMNFSRVSIPSWMHPTDYLSSSSKRAQDAADKELVVDILKKYTLTTFPSGIRNFNRKYPYFVTRTSASEVVACVHRKMTTDDLAVDLATQITEDCAVELEETVERGLPDAQKAPDLPEIEVEWDRVVICLVWNTCSKLEEWKKLPIPADTGDY
ncbi:uncharacterized protein PG998_011770 [Apiospora kogelbergensis]|uniref:uncharacterized protein n=1 Tax=Apiospora kogelbergensis TaxID=1337665 RepID=UPI003132488A